MASSDPGQGVCQSSCACEGQDEILGIRIKEIPSLIPGWTEMCYSDLFLLETTGLFSCAHLSHKKRMKAGPEVTRC